MCEDKHREGEAREQGERSEDGRKNFFSLSHAMEQEREGEQQREQQSSISGDGTLFYFMREARERYFTRNEKEIHRVRDRRKEKKRRREGEEDKMTTLLFLCEGRLQRKKEDECYTRRNFSRFFKFFGCQKCYFSGFFQIFWNFWVSKMNYLNLEYKFFNLK